MKQKLGIVMMLVGVVACVAFSMERMDAQSAGPVNMFSSGPMQLSISTRSGQLLTSLEIPAGVAVSVSAPSAFANGDPLDGTQTPSMFTGDVSIRTRPSSELVQGLAREQMLAGPFRLDVKDAVVVVSKK